MIQMPRRSVTRFFIPLIDVLTLLFCIYLLMPLVKKTGDGEPAGSQGSGTTPVGVEKEPEKEKEPAALLEQERFELERLRREKIELLKQRLSVQVLEIDGKDGRLFHRGADKVEVASQADVADLIGRNKKEAGPRELYYLFLYPSRGSGYPEQGQVLKYRKWFQGVAHNLDD